jgi:hypothetical protein
MRNVSTILARNPDKKRPLGSPGISGRIILKWMLLKGTVLEGVDWINVVQVRNITGVL